jgi:hypothetical protein
MTRRYRQYGHLGMLPVEAKHHLLMYLSQQATSSSMGVCLVRHFRRPSAKFRQNSQPRKPASSTWLRAIGNLQQWLIGTHHGVSRAQLPVYLDEFVFRRNRRKQPMAAPDLAGWSGNRPQANALRENTRRS